MRTSARTLLIAGALAALAASAPVASASSDQIVLRRDGSEAVPFVAHPVSGPHHHGIVLRRDGSEAVAFASDPLGDGRPSAGPPADGFDWGDAVLGAGAGALLAMAAMLAMGVRPPGFARRPRSA